MNTQPEIVEEIDIERELAEGQKALAEELREGAEDLNKDRDVAIADLEKIINDPNSSYDEVKRAKNMKRMMTIRDLFTLCHEDLKPKVKRYVRDAKYREQMDKEVDIRLRKAQRYKFFPLSNLNAARVVLDMEGLSKTKAMLILRAAFVCYMNTRPTKTYGLFMAQLQKRINNLSIAAVDSKYKDTAKMQIEGLINYYR